MFCGNVNPFLDSLLLAWFERRFRHCVDRNQIHVAKKSFAELQKLLQVGFLVVHVIYHDVLECDAAIRDFDIACKAALQFGQGERIRFRHKMQSRCLACRMKRYGKRELLGLVGKTLDSWDDAARGNADMARADAEALVAVHDA